jgi:hypothetical protein
MVMQITDNRQTDQRDHEAKNTSVDTFTGEIKTNTRHYQYHVDLTRLCPYNSFTCSRPGNFHCPKRRFMTREVKIARTINKIETKVIEYCRWWDKKVEPADLHDYERSLD